MHNIKIYLVWWHFVSDKKKIIPALAISTCMVFYPVILKLQNYNWDALFAYVQCYFLNTESTIKIWDVQSEIISVHCADILNNTEYTQIIYSGIILSIFTLLAICVIPIILLTVYFVIYIIILALKRFQ
ncbi:MAG TPA: hypothetical protein LFV91_06720 [Rickettsia endosymbiont of Bembidion nr. Transversale]|nr:hypothetical protein [Rickettsia endosymbiont of Bembidion nr. Transversale]